MIIRSLRLEVKIQSWHYEPRLLYKSHYVQNLGKWLNCAAMLWKLRTQNNKLIQHGTILNSYKLYMNKVNML